MGELIAQALKGFAGLLDKWVPGEGVRTIVVAVLQIVGSIAFFLTHQITAEVAGMNIFTALGLIFSSLHKNPA